MTTLGQRIDNILGPWPTPDGTLEAFRLLARHIQRHDELVSIQRDIDGYAECRRMPDDALDALDAHRDRLRREIWEETPALHLAREAETDTGLPPLTLNPMAFYGWGPDAATKQMDDAVERWAVELGQRITKDADGKMAAALRELGFVPKAELDAANANYRAMHDAWLERNDTIRKMDKRNRELEAELAEHRRMSSHVATVMRREEALKKRVEELEHEKYVGQVKGWADEYERDANAEVGRAIRGLRPRKGHISVTLTVTVIDDAVSLARVTWEELYRAAGGATACYHGRGCVIPAIAEYIKEEG